MSISLALIPHPDSRCSAVTRIDVDVVYRRGMLELHYVVTGAIGDLLIPAAAPSERAESLWEHTCFEAFVQAAGEEGYWELNFSPSTQWAAYRFARRRLSTGNAAIDPPLIATTSALDRLEVRVELALTAGAAAWRLGLSAVIEESNERKSYWALAHAPGVPDFHREDCFVLELPAATQP